VNIALHVLFEMRTEYGILPFLIEATFIRRCA
jgi:hypothetical protein